MHPLFLSDIEARTREHPLLQAVGKARGVIPGIFHLFAFKPAAARHLLRYTQEVMRGPSPLSAGWRELIAAFTSAKNLCPF